MSGYKRAFLLTTVFLQSFSSFAGVTFGPAQTIVQVQEGRVQEGLATADLDGDGYSDLVRSESWDENNGATAPFFKGNVFPGLADHTVADLNRDGKPDIISISDGLCWFENKGNPPSFTKHRIELNFLFRNACAADLDKDGNMDLVGTNFYNFTIHWLKNNGGDQPVFSDNVIATFTTGPCKLATGDLDSDDDIDIIVSEFDPAHESYTYWMENNGENPPHFTSHLITGEQIGSVSIVDFNRDGRPDILIGGSWCENNGAKPPGYIFHRVTAGDYFESAPGDFNGDGWMDYVSFGDRRDLATDSTHSLYLFENDGKTSPSFNRFLIGGVGYRRTAGFQPQIYIKKVIVADVDRDGDPDPIILHYNSGIKWFPNLRLSPKPVSLFDPTGGEHFLSGADMPVSWRTDVAQAGNTVTLDLWRGTSQCVAVLAAADASPIGVGIHSVRLPYVPSGNDYRVRAVSLLDSALFDFSDGPFTISSPNPVRPKYWLGYR